MHRLALLTLAAALGGAGCQPESRRATPQGPSGSPPRPLDAAALRALPEDHAVGELVYVPIYASAFHPFGREDIDLVATLSIHNVALERSIRVSAVSYFDTGGKPIREYTPEPIVLSPMETRQFVIAERDESGVTGANFLVKWTGTAGTSSPMIEAVMLSTTRQQGISLSSRGTVIERLTRD